MSTAPVPDTAQTLEQRLAEGKIPVAQALRYAIMLAEALRGLHDAGQAHGAVSPVNVTITSTGLGLLPALAPAAVPYTAPELLQGNPADPRSDIFSFGTVVYEMLAGRPAFGADDPAALAEAVSSAAPPSCGNSALDRFLATCLAKDPAARFGRMQKILLELKLLAVGVRRAEGPARREKADAALRSELQKVETRVASQLEAQGKAVSDAGRAAGAAVDALREQLSAFATQFAVAQEQAAQSYEAAGERIAARIVPDIEAIAQRTANVEQALVELGLRATQTEQGLEGLRQASANLQENVAADIQEIHQNLKAQRAAIDSARTGVAQTDDLVERVVEALELLQTSVMEQAEGRSANVD